MYEITDACGFINNDSINYLDLIEYLKFLNKWRRIDLIIRAIAKKKYPINVLDVI